MSVVAATEHNSFRSHVYWVSQSGELQRVGQHYSFPTVVSIFGNQVKSVGKQLLSQFGGAKALSNGLQLIADLGI